MTGLSRWLARAGQGFFDLLRDGEKPAFAAGGTDQLKSERHAGGVSGAWDRDDGEAQGLPGAAEYGRTRGFKPVGSGSQGGRTQDRIELVQPG